MSAGCENSTSAQVKTLPDIDKEFQKAVDVLNTLQKPASYTQGQEVSKSDYSNLVVETEKYLLRADMTWDSLDTLSVIHVAGTKGKGTTCALCESILRHHGYRTGFFSSPHLLDIRERIRINGVPISKEVFSYHFWQIFNVLNDRKESETDVPRLFMFLTIMALKVFLTERVDVAIIEVGIGGQYSSTNILRKVPIVAITSLGYDHTNLLGNTIEEIAWHKAGIMQPGSQVYTVPQVESALSVFRQRSVERNCYSLKIVEPNQNLSVVNKNYPGEVFNLNANLAVALSQAWIDQHIKLENTSHPTNKNVLSLKATMLGLSTFSWPGRYQIIQNGLNSFYIDGAHTCESIKICAEWFKSMTDTSGRKNALIFNVTSYRNAEDLLKLLTVCEFITVLFVPNVAFSTNSEDKNNSNILEETNINRCHDHYRIWKSFNTSAKTIKVLHSVSDALQECLDNYNVLITGSLHLVGAALSVIDMKS